MESKDTPKEGSWERICHQQEDEVLLESNKDALQPSQLYLPLKELQILDPKLAMHMVDKIPALPISNS